MSRIYEDWLSAYIRYSKHSEAPESFHFWTAVSAIAGALRRKVWIDQGYFQWTPNFYIIFVAPPGIVAKSTTANIGMNLLRKVGGINFGPDVITWQRLTEAMSEASEEIAVDGGFMPQSAITIVSDEFGTFLNPQNTEMIDVLVSLWDGKIGEWKKSTKTQGEDVIINPWINMIACTTPAWLAGNFPTYMIGGGFTSRCVFVFGKDKRHLAAYPKKHMPPDHEDNKMKLIRDLEHISMIGGEYTIDPEAEDYGEGWYTAHHSKKPKHLDAAVWGGYWARKQGHVHKLAIILAASQRDERIILLSDLQRAVTLMGLVEEDLPKVFSLIGKTQSAKNNEQVISFIQRQVAVDREVVVQELFNAMGVDEVLKGVESGIRAGLITQSIENSRVVYRYAAKHSKEPAAAQSS